jgi:peptidoglycan/xylan/chitin deacetylase (PgdA/CDA1 family)
MNRRGALRAAAAAAGVLYTASCDRGSAGPATTTWAAPSSSGATAPPGPSPSGSAGPSGGALPAEVVHGPRDRPSVALTFHGQGDAALVRQLLDLLVAEDTRVTVLAVGSWLASQPDMAKRVLDGGHELGNHTQNHAAIAKMPAAQAYAEINTCAQQLKKLTGSIGTWFRPSQTQSATPTIRAQAAKVGYPTCLSYDLDSLDYTDPGTDVIVNTTMRTVQNGSIVSLHFGHAGTIAALPRVLDGLRQRGLHPVTMTELVS